MLKKQVRYLSQIVSPARVAADPEKVAAVE